jgi:hypothetical protein
MQDAFRNWIFATDTGDFWLLVAGAVAFAGFGCFSALACYRRARLIEDTPTARIRSAPQGYVEVTGQAEPLEGALLRAPLTGTPCVWYRYEICKKTRRPGVGTKGFAVRHTWKRVEGEASTESFVVDDGTGTCVVHPEGAKTIVSSKDTWYGSSRHPSGGPRGSWTDHLGSYKYHEERIEPASPLYAMGWFKTIGAAGEAGLDEEIRDELAALKQDKAGLLARFDDNRDGEISMTEWERARAAVREQTILDRAKRDATQSSVHTLARTPERRFPFLLATKPQHRLAREQRLQALGLAALFVIGTGFSLSALLTRFGS